MSQKHIDALQENSITINVSHLGIQPKITPTQVDTLHIGGDNIRNCLIHEHWPKLSDVTHAWLPALDYIDCTGLVVILYISFFRFI